MECSAKLAITLTINKPIHKKQMSFLTGKVGKEKFMYINMYWNQPPNTYHCSDTLYTNTSIRRKKTGHCQHLIDMRHNVQNKAGNNKDFAVGCCKIQIT